MEDHRNDGTGSEMHVRVPYHREDYTTKACIDDWILETDRSSPGSCRSGWRSTRGCIMYSMHLILTGCRNPFWWNDDSDTVLRMVIVYGDSSTRGTNMISEWRNSRHLCDLVCCGRSRTEGVPLEQECSLAVGGCMSPLSQGPLDLQLNVQRSVIGMRQYSVHWF